MFHRSFQPAKMLTTAEKKTNVIITQYLLRHNFSSK